MDPFQSQFHDFEANEFLKSIYYIYIYMNFQISGKVVLIRREDIFLKVVRLDNDAKPYRQNILGPNFQEHLLLHLSTSEFCFLGPG